jgi:hypothetical protein
MEGPLKRRKRTRSSSLASLQPPPDFWRLVSKYCQWPELIALSMTCSTARRVLSANVKSALDRVSAHLDKMVYLSQYNTGKFIYRLRTKNSVALFGVLNSPWYRYPVTQFLSRLVWKTEHSLSKIERWLGQDFARFFRITGVTQEKRRMRWHKWTREFE